MFRVLIVRVQIRFVGMDIALDMLLIATSERGAESAFFCSGRYSNRGCGHTFSLLWSHLLVRSSLCSKEIMELINEASSSSQSLYRLWWKGGYGMSLSSAYRYWRRWKKSFGHLRAQLSRDHPPPHSDQAADAQMVLHLSKAFGEESTGWVRSFQEAYQRPLFIS